MWAQAKTMYCPAEILNLTINAEILTLKNQEPSKLGHVWG